MLVPSSSHIPANALLAAWTARLGNGKQTFQTTLAEVPLLVLAELAFQLHTINQQAEAHDAFPMLRHVLFIDL